MPIPLQILIAIPIMVIWFITLPFVILHDMCNHFLGLDDI